jgi:signal transduction histidine kinase
LRFDALSAGAHRLLISAREKGGDWGEPASVELRQEPRLYETWWFRIGAVALAIVILLLIYRWRMYILRMRYAAVLVERNRIAREWHDTLLAGFSAISWQLDATMKRLKDKPETATQTLEVAHTMVHHYKAEARRVIWDLRHDTPEPESVVTALRRALQEMMADRGIDWHLTVEGTARTLPGELSQNVLRICQEAASNAVRHAEPSRLDVSLRFPAEHVELTVRDNGRGFDPRQVPPGHFGLQIMQERARRFGGSVHVQSSVGEGTTITAEIPG